VYALEGTSAHALLEVCMLTGSDPADYLGVVIEKGLMPVDEGMADGVGYALDFIQAYVADHPNATVYSERTVHYGETIETEDDIGFGTSDIIIDNHPDELVVIDYKHGIGIPVTIKNNSQIRLYMLGAKQEFGRRYRRYRGVVVQPRAPKRKPVQEACWTDPELFKWVKGTVIPVVPVALSKDAPRVAGSHCRYCAADGNCKAQYDLVLKAAQKDFA
jgi:hypothetical protein